MSNRDEFNRAMRRVTRPLYHEVEQNLAFIRDVYLAMTATERRHFRESVSQINQGDVNLQLQRFRLAKTSAGVW